MQNLKEIQDLEERSINPLIRIADALEEILRLVKKDQEESKKRWEASDQRDEEYNSEIDKWVEGLLTQWCIYTIGAGSRPMATSNKLQAASYKRQAWQENITMILYPIK